MDRITFGIVACLLALVWPGMVAAAPLDEIRSGSLLRAAGDGSAGQPLPRVATRAEIAITGPIARVRLRQQFENPSADWIEAIYAFPLPEDAAVDHLRMQVGELMVQGEIQVREQARKTYETAKAEGRQASLVEQARPNLFTSAVANIAPHSDITIEIEYQQSVRWEDGQFSLRLPLGITPRYQPGTAPDAPSGQLRGWSLLPGEIPNVVAMTPDGQPRGAGQRVQITVALQPGFALDTVTSPSHGITRTPQGQGVRIGLRGGEAPADRDFVLRWSPPADAQPQGAFFVESTDQGHYGLLMLLPPADNFTAQAMVAREQILVIDSSGSMGGASLRQAKAALLLALDRLRPGDTFNVIDFDSDARALFPQPVPLTPESRQRARAFVAGLDAGGGTELSRALELALGQARPRSGLLRQVVFTTDGAIGGETRLLRQIHQSLGDARLFMVGIGSAPNTYFMEEAARAGRGVATLIGNLAEVQTRMDALFAKIERPALTDLQLALGVDADVLPDPLPDLYAGQPLVAVMRLDACPQQAQVTGRIAGMPWQANLDLQGDETQRGLGVRWAREKIRDWMRAGLRGEDAAAVREAITDLGLAHHLVSRHTSLVAVDKTPLRLREQVLASRPVPAQMPAGWQRPGTAVALAQGATPALLYLFAGGLMALLGLMLARRST